MEKPIVSIIIPVYKSEKFLDNCIKSILNQTFENFEIILVNDGSPDNSGDICDKYTQKDHRIKSYHKKNGGAASARKYGVEKAQGKWILFSDSDDIMPNEAIENLINIDNGNCDLIIGTILYKKQRLLLYTENFDKSISKEDYLKTLLDRKTYYGPCSKLIKRTLFDDINWDTDKEIFQNEDLLMLIKLALKTTQDILISNNYIHYHCIEKEDSVSTKQMPLEGWYKLFKKIRNELETTKFFNKSIKQAYINYIVWSLYVYILTNGLLVNKTSLLNEIREFNKQGLIYNEYKKQTAYIINPIHQIIYVLKRKIRINLSILKNKLL